MNVRQINFFILPKEEKDFIKFVKSTNDIILLPYRFKKIPFKPLEELPKPFSAPFWMSIYFYNKAIGTVKYHYVEKQNHYYVSSDESCVVNLSRCGINEKNELLEGGISIETAYVVKDSSGKLVWKKKPVEFYKWYEKISRWLKRKEFKKFGKGYGSTYISKNVIRWVQNGGELLFHTLTFADIETMKK